MAIQQSVTQNGVTATYHIIASLRIEPLVGSGTVVMRSFATKEAEMTGEPEMFYLTIDAPSLPSYVPTTAVNGGQLTEQFLIQQVDGALFGGIEVA